ncbi:MAG: aliphatic sulfonate ABC transporter substrate-binding protein [Burkholderiales bacterium]|nr:aliphatic sulfonate ABC transporter substrate-binding protein [Burkholderiales bacterium]
MMNLKKRPDNKGSIGLAVMAIITIFCIGVLWPVETLAEDMATIRIGYQPAQNVRFFMAREGKYFESLGLKTQDIKFTAGPPAFSALQSKSIDVAAMGAVPAVSAIAQGIKIKIILLVDDSSGVEGLVARPESGIKSINDIVGKKVGATKGSTSWYALFKALDYFQLDPKKVEILDIPFPALIPVFSNGDVDALWVWSPWINKLTEAGNHIVARDRDVNVKFGMVWVAREEWLAKNPVVVMKFIEALDMGERAFKKEPEKLKRILQRELGLTDNVVEDLLKREYFPDFEEQVNPRYELSMVSDDGLPKALQGIADFMYRQKINTTNPRISEFIESVFLEKYVEKKRK